MPGGATERTSPFSLLVKDLGSTGLGAQGRIYPGLHGAAAVGLLWMLGDRVAVRALGPEVVRGVWCGSGRERPWVEEEDPSGSPAKWRDAHAHQDQKHGEEWLERPGKLPHISDLSHPKLPCGLPHVPCLLSFPVVVFCWILPSKKIRPGPSPAFLLWRQ